MKTSSSRPRLDSVPVVLTVALSIALGCSDPRADPLPLDHGPGAEAVELRREIQETATAACMELGPSLTLLSVARTRVDLPPETMQCLQLTTPAELLGPSIHPRSREEADAPVTHWLSGMGAAALPLLRHTLENPEASEAERHLAFWALARMLAHQRPFSAGIDEGQCLVEQWQHDAGRTLEAAALARSFEPWPEDRPMGLDENGVPELLPDPRLPSPFDQPRRPTVVPDPERDDRFSEQLSRLNRRRASAVEAAAKTLEALQKADSSSWQTPPEEMRSALAVYAVLRPDLQQLHRDVLPFTERPDVAAWPADRDPVFHVLASYGVEILKLLASRLTSDDPKIRQKHDRLLKEVVGGSVAADCLLQLWAQSSSEETPGSS